MRESLFQTDLIIKKEGNQRLIGLAAIPNGCPLRKRYFDTTPCGRCKGFIREREEVPMVEAFVVSPVWVCEVMGARVYGAVF
jgi:hypothetical protein